MLPARILTAMLIALAIAAPAARGSNCAATSTGRVPLIDLGSGLYQGYPGGLYGAGANVRPPAHGAAGIAIANALEPIDTLGASNPNGRIVLISIGMSNCTQEFSTFVPIATSDPQRNPRVQVIDCALGGQATQDIRLPTAAYWDTVASRLRGHRSSLLQPQAVWIKEARRSPTEAFPASAESLTNDLGLIVRIIHAKLPHVKLVYITSRIYAGYASSTLNPEPYAYESGFAVKWLIDAQIAGVDSLNFDPNGGAVRAPWLSWGPYLWADGETPRSDGLTWHCNDFVTDGTHPSGSGRTKVADSLLTFFHRDATTEPWYVNHTVAVPDRPSLKPLLTIAPNPATGPIDVRFTRRRGETWRMELVDLAGGRVATLGEGVGTGAPQALRWSARGVRPGIYWARLQSASGFLAKRIAIIGCGERW